MNPKSHECALALQERFQIFAQNSMDLASAEDIADEIAEFYPSEEDVKAELLFHEMCLHSMLDAMDAPKHPDDDPARPAYGSYGRLRAWGLKHGIKDPLWDNPALETEREGL